jgi:prepilin-type N-terminal cleavage/methylation domain-containing protein
MQDKGNQAGYTLIELLIAIAILGLATAIAIPVLSTSLTGAQFRADERAVVTLLRQCQNESVKSQHTIIITTPTDLFALAKHNGQSINPETSLHIVDSVRCFDDGTTTGGRIHLQNGTHSIFITFGWLNGAITLE